MSNQLCHLLARWEPLKDTHKWVVGIIFKTEGSCYRKAGAVMLFSDAGHQLGVLSGGCLESDIAKKARRVMDDGRSRTAVYDDNDEDDIAFKLGVGCGGIVHLALLPVSAENKYLQLATIYKSLSNGNACAWTQTLGGSLASSVSDVNCPSQRPALLSDGKEQQITIYCAPPTHILIIGGGFDATYVANMAQNLGWIVSVWDPRPAQARVEFFADVNFIVESPDVSALNVHIGEHHVDAAVLMSHHRDIDSKALAALSRHQLAYIAMLGPKHRKDEIFALANVNDADFSGYFASPAGFDIGGELPESIALSIISQCHSVLAGKSARSTLNK